MPETFFKLVNFGKPCCQKKHLYFGHYPKVASDQLKKWKFQFGKKCYYWPNQFRYAFATFLLWSVLAQLFYKVGKFMIRIWSLYLHGILTHRNNQITAYWTVFTLTDRFPSNYCSLIGIFLYPSEIYHLHIDFLLFTKRK